MVRARRKAPDARLYKKSDGQSRRLCDMGHVVMENRNGLAVEATLTPATGTAAREATPAMLDLRARKPITPGADHPWRRQGPERFAFDQRRLIKGETQHSQRLACLGSPSIEPD